MRPRLANTLFIEKQNGMTLIEVLVALLIFSIGIMGMISLQLLVGRQVDDQKNRNIAIWTGNELIQRIRSNNQDGAIVQYANDVSSLNAVNGYAICNAQPAVLCADYYDPLAGAKTAAAPFCTETQMATYDVWQIFCQTAGTANENTVSNEADNIFDSVKGFSASLTCPADQAAGLPCSSTSDLALRIQWSSASASSDSRLTGKINDALGNEIDATEDFYILQFRP